MSSIMRRRNGLIASSVMGMLLSRVKVVDPSSQDRTPPCATVLAPPPAAANYRASGLVLWHEADVRGALIHFPFRGNSGHRNSKASRLLLTDAVEKVAA